MATLDATLLAAIRPGRENIKSSYALAQETGVAQRAIGFMVNRLREEGQCIGSAHGEGYYRITNQDELMETVAHIEHRKVGIDRTVKALCDSFGGV